MNHWSNFSCTLQCAPRIASSSTKCCLLLHFSRYFVALNLTFTAYTFSPIFPNFLSSLPQMKPPPSQVRNHYSQKNQEAHHHKALAFKKGANLCCPSNVCFPSCIVCCDMDDSCSRFPHWSRITTPIRSSVMVKVKTLESSPYRPISNKTIWITHRRFYFLARRVGTIHHELKRVPLPQK